MRIEFKLNEKTKKFIKKFKEKQPELYYGYVFVPLEEYKNKDVKMLWETKYGNCYCYGSSLIKGIVPKTKSYVDKNKYFLLMFQELQPELYLELTLVGEFNGLSKKCIMKDKYGLLKINPYTLLSGVKPDISSAIDKSSYFRNVCTNIIGNKYGYDLVNYKNAKTKVVFLCPKHGEFKMTPDNFLAGKKCKKCSEEEQDGMYTETIAERNKDAIVYTILCSNDFESFYKIGITTTSIRERFNDAKRCRIILRL